MEQIGEEAGGSGHRQMRVWQNVDRLDMLAQKILIKIPRHDLEMRPQIDSASDSIGANFVEGYYSGSLGDYIRFLRYSQRSLGELQERIRRVLRKGYIGQDEYTEFDDLAIKTMYLLDRLLSSLINKREGMAKEEEATRRVKRAQEGRRGDKKAWKAQEGTEQDLP